MVSPYYQDDSVMLYHGRAEDVLASLADQSVNCVITDPPYTERTHVHARSNSKSATAGGRTLHGSKAAFESITDLDLINIFAEMGRVTRRWVIASLAYQHAFAFDSDPPAGLKMMRVGVWIKTNPMPQISADRPGVGWEAIAYLHRSDVKARWHGGGKAGNFTLPLAQNTGHPTAKPLAMVAEWVRNFTDLGDLILDPFAGSGTTLRAAKDEGRRAIGVEMNEAYCEIAARRLAQDAFDFGGAA